MGSASTRRRSRRPETVDLGGRCVLPAFTDSHVHFPTWSLAQRQVKLDGCESIEEALARVRAADDAPRAAGCAATAGATATGAPASSRRRRRWTRSTGETPTILISKDYHSVWLNSAALAAADGDLQVDGGVVERDERGRADRHPARGVGLAVPRPLRPDDDGRVGRGDAARPQARGLARRRRDPRQGRLARRARHLPATARRGEPDAARVGLDPGRARRATRPSCRCGPASATTSCGSAT